MVIFFFVVGLEIKRELVSGALSNFRTASLPLLGAIGGMVVPALIYIGINAGDAEAMRGWAIPAATDIAFAVGVIALLGSRVPTSLKVFILALAIIDDLGAIVIIALFYTENLSPLALAAGLVVLAMLIGLNRLGYKSAWPYLVLGFLLWLCVLKSGVHATLAGVVTAFAVPLGTDDRTGPAERLEHNLSPYVSFLVLPAFAFANAGVSSGRYRHRQAQRADTAWYRIGALSRKGSWHLAVRLGCYSRGTEPHAGGRECSSAVRGLGAGRDWVHDEFVYWDACFPRPCIRDIDPAWRPGWLHSLRNNRLSPASFRGRQGCRPGP